MTAAGMTSVSVSFETRRQLNSMKVMDNHRSVDDLLADLVKQYKVLRMRGVVDDLRSRFSELEEMDVDALVRKLAMSPFAV
jgi:CRISPR/Cas system type I-B associated protein Csh2 (Cas7 group RAMP superfamily)